MRTILFPFNGLLSPPTLLTIYGGKTAIIHTIILVRLNISFVKKTVDKREKNAMIYIYKVNELKIARDHWFPLDLLFRHDLHIVITKQYIVFL